MEWKEYTVWCYEDAVEAVSAVFHQIGSNGVVVEEAQYVVDNPALETWAVKTIPPDFRGRHFMMVKSYFPSEAELYSDLWQQMQKIEEHLGSRIVLWQENIQDEAWKNAWRAYYHINKIGERLVICPSWEDYDPTPEEAVVKIDPGMAFGTGIHATTRSCLYFLERYVQAGKHGIDCGCGSGILAIAAAKLGAGQILAVDLDEEAVRVARENVQINQLTDRIKVKEANALEILKRESFDLILANLTSDILLHLIPLAAKALQPGGSLIASGILDTRWDEVLGVLTAHGFEVQEVMRDGEWIGFIACLVGDGATKGSPYGIT